MRGLHVLAGAPVVDIPAGITYGELADWVASQGGDPLYIVRAAVEQERGALGFSFADVRKAAGKVTRGAFEVVGMPTVGAATVSITDSLRKAVTAGLEAGKKNIEGEVTGWAAGVGQRLIDALPIDARTKAGAYALAPWLLPAGLAAGAVMTKGVTRLALGGAAAFVALQTVGRK